jgi:hypothetical protein
MEVAQLIVGSPDTGLRNSPFFRTRTGLESIADGVLDLADLQVAVATLVKFIAVVGHEGGELLLDFPQQLFVLLIDVEDEVFEGRSHLFLLPCTLDSYFMKALPQDLLFALLLDQQLTQCARTVGQTLP